MKELSSILELSGKDLEAALLRSIDRFLARTTVQMMTTENPSDLQELRWIGLLEAEAAVGWATQFLEGDEDHRRRGVFFFSVIDNPLRYNDFREFREQLKAELGAERVLTQIALLYIDFFRRIGARENRESESSSSMSPGPLTDPEWEFVRAVVSVGLLGIDSRKATARAENVLPSIEPTLQGSKQEPGFQSGAFYVAFQTAWEDRPGLGLHSGSLAERIRKKIRKYGERPKLARADATDEAIEKYSMEIYEKPENDFLSELVVLTKNSGEEALLTAVADGENLASAARQAGVSEGKARALVDRLRRNRPRSSD